MKKQCALWDGIEGEFLYVDSEEEAKKYIEDNYTEGDTAHPDILSCIFMEVLPSPVASQLH